MSMVGKTATASWSEGGPQVLAAGIIELICSCCLQNSTVTFAKAYPHLQKVFQRTQEAEGCQLNALTLWVSARSS